MAESALYYLLLRQPMDLAILNQETVFFLKVAVVWFFEVFFILKYIKIIFFIYFFKFILNIITSKQSKNIKKINL
jgi:hypothetical protein